jgi:hypothetical protein
MRRSSNPKPLEWSEIGVLAMLGGLVVFGLAANGLSLLQSLVALGFGAGVGGRSGTGEPAGRLRPGTEWFLG